MFASFACPPTAAGRATTARSSSAAIRAKASFPAVAATAWRFNAWAKYNDWKLDAPVATQRLQSGCGIPVWQPDRKSQRQAAAHRAGRRQHRRQRPRHAHHHRRMPAERGAAAQSGGHARAARRALRRLSGRRRRSSGWSAASPATTRTGTSTTSLASSRPRTVVTAYEPDPDDPNHEPLQRQFSLAEEEAPTSQASR